MLTYRTCRRGNNRRGTVMIYVLLTFTVMMGFCALAVDLARAQAAKTELRRIADAASLAAVANIGGGSSSELSNARNIAIAMVTNNSVDGSKLTLKSTDIVFGNWDSVRRIFAANISPINAVRVVAQRTTGEGGPIPLMFAQALGKPSLDLLASSTAAVVTVTAQVSVSAHSNLWLAGQPVGATASKQDPGYPNSTHKWQLDIANPNYAAGTLSPSGEPYDSPPIVTDPNTGNPMTLTAGDVVTVSNVTGTAQNDPNGAVYTANGTPSKGGSGSTYDDDASHLNNPSYYGPPSNGTVTGQNENGISDVYAPINSILGVFLPGTNAETPPVAGQAPGQVLNFSNINILPDIPDGVAVSQVSQNYTSLSPKVQQSFYAGDGQTSSGQQQQIVVPKGAGSLFLGTLDGHEWSNNKGGYSATVTRSRIELVQ